MSNDINETPKVTKVAEPAGLTNDQLMKMMLDTQKQLADALKEQSAAIRESRIPYVDPAVLAQKQAALEEKRAAVKLEQRRRVATKAQCPHKRTNSDGTFSEKLNIKWQEHSNGIILGTCGTCFSPFDARNPKDLALLRADGTAIKNMGRARENTRLGM